MVFCYTIGKAQRLLAELSRVADTPISVHGALLPMVEAYRTAGVVLPSVQTVIDRPRGASFAGALILAPPSARGTPWMRRLGRYSDGLASGLMRVRGVRRQRAYDRGFVALLLRRLAGPARDRPRNRGQPGGGDARPRGGAGPVSG